MSNNAISSLDVRDYVGPFRVSSAHAQHMARAMEAAMPPDASDDERSGMVEVVAAAAVVEDVLSDRDRFSQARVRPAFVSFGTAWSVLGDMLAALARMPADATARGPRAATLYASIFPDGTTFVKLDAGAAWAAGQRRLDRIDADGITASVDELVGADVLVAARRATANLREATGAGPAPRDVPSSTALSEATAAFGRELGGYCRVLVAKLDETNASSVARFKRAVFPLDEYRSARRSDDDTEGDLFVAPANDAIAPGMPGASPFITNPTT